MLSRIPVDVLEGVLKLLDLDHQSAIKDFTFSSGGCINQGGRLQTSKGVFFLKWNNERKFPGMFQAESKGLQLLHAQNSVRIPKVIGCITVGSHQLLLLEFIEQHSRAKNYWQQLGAGLANLHRCTSNSFGLDHHNYIGSLTQINSRSFSWTEFFVEQRLHVQLKQAVDAGAAPIDWNRKFELLYGKLPSLLPLEKPSLLHGDLWSGNLINDDKGEPCLIDPAVYYGNREADLAMTKLFGGFDDEFYFHYNQAF